MIERLLIIILERWTGKIVTFIGHKVDLSLYERRVEKKVIKVKKMTEAFELEPNDVNRKNLIDASRKLAHSIEL